MKKRRRRRRSGWFPVEPETGLKLAGSVSKSVVGSTRVGSQFQELGTSPDRIGSGFWTDLLLKLRKNLSLIRR